MKPVSIIRYRRIVAIAAALLALIVLTGAAVRLTEAGLGCSDWPNCHEGELLPAEQDLLGLIEFGNRMITGVIGIATMAVALLAHRLRPRRPDLLPWAWALVAGTVAQALLGALVVRLELDPITVAGHFVLSLVMLWNVVVLWLKAGAPPGSTIPRFGGVFTTHARVMLGLITATVLVGTMVTGTGPNSGDSRAERLGFEFTTIARSHSVTAWCFLLAALTLAVRLGRERVPTDSTGRALVDDPIRLSRLVVYAAAAQGAIGYWQYLTGVPPLLVEFHVAGSVVLWFLCLFTYFSLFDRVGMSVSEASSTSRQDVTAGVGPSPSLPSLSESRPPTGPDSANPAPRRVPTQQNLSRAGRACRHSADQ